MNEQQRKALLNAKRAIEEMLSQEEHSDTCEQCGKYINYCDCQEEETHRKKEFWIDTHENAGICKITAWEFDGDMKPRIVDWRVTSTPLWIPRRANLLRSSMSDRGYTEIPSPTK
jgi:hypothetical protein